MKETMAPRVALLNADITDESDETYRNFNRDVEAEVINYDVVSGELPNHGDFDAVIVTGSAASAYWDDEWIRELEQWVADEIDTGTPVLGVCFGHQLVAQAVGGTVEARGEYEIGYHEIETVAESNLFDGIPSRFLAFTTHSDEVVELPDEARLIAENEYSLQAFECGNAFGVQFHPEYDRQTAERITRGKDELTEEKKQTVIENITVENEKQAEPAKRIFQNFLDTHV